MSKTSLPVLGENQIEGKSQSKEQIQFNKLTQKIADLRLEIDKLKGISDRTNTFMMGEYAPVETKFNNELCEMVRLYDRAFTSGNFNKTQEKKLKWLITDLAYDLINECGHDELKEIYDRHNPDEPFDAANEEADDESNVMMKEMLEAMGFDIDEDMDMSDPEKMAEFLENQLREKEAAEENRQKNKKKSAKKLEKEAEKEAEAAKISKSVREVYMDLVKTFHPDLELDEAEKVRKTAIMQRITAAYEADDLLGLLQLQLEYERIDQKSLDNIGTERLQHFVKVLRNQANELAFERDRIKQTLQMMAEGPEAVMFGSTRGFKPEGVEFSFKRRLAELKTKLKMLKQEIEYFRETKNLKDYLTDFRIPKDNGFGDLFNF
jgi:hypothetical protein